MAVSIRTSDRILSRLPEGLLVLLARLGMAGVFWRSGQTKVDGWTVTDATVFLFAEEYRLPLLPPELAAWLAAGAEHLFPVLLVLGLGSRYAALALAAMTLVIQIFVYPGLWPDHLTWLAALLLIVARGGGPLSLDALLASRHR
ncbi:DoxX family protein [Novispirillum itersonii]|uniref:Putative oxidoreductase n=1 Tax=Novispirillum itersonii TaxID=189 RepID=A0A7W9ZIQ9_NOVIT|nr:DoxX family protein [Novispirillum itersonii]MBB6210894.1 putative oxidoreductase [Novispirillum itersonii]